MLDELMGEVAESPATIATAIRASPFRILASAMVAGSLGFFLMYTARQSRVDDWLLVIGWLSLPAVVAMGAAAGPAKVSRYMVCAVPAVIAAAVGAGLVTYYFPASGSDTGPFFVETVVFGSVVFSPVCLAVGALIRWRSVVVRRQLRERAT